MPDVVAMCRKCVDLERVPVKDSGFFVDCNGPDEANNISQTTHNITEFQVSTDWPKHTKFRSARWPQARPLPPLPRRRPKYGNLLRTAPLAYLNCFCRTSVQAAIVTWEAARATYQPNLPVRSSSDRRLLVRSQVALSPLTQLCH